MGLQNLPLKIAVFLRGTILSACLVAVGWKSGVVLEGTARQGMTISFALVPACRPFLSFQVKSPMLST